MPEIMSANMTSTWSLEAREPPLQGEWSRRHSSSQHFTQQHTLKLCPTSHMFAVLTQCTVCAQPAPSRV